MSTPPVGTLVMAHGTPRSAEGLAGFVTAIRHGVPPSAAELAELSGRYASIGGVSPLGAITAAQVAGIQLELDRTHPGTFAVHLGTRYAAPSIGEAADALAERGCARVVGIVLSPFDSGPRYAGYGELAGKAATARGLALSLVEPWWHQPGFVQLLAGRVRDAIAGLGDDGKRAVCIFTAHSVPAGDGGAGVERYAEHHTACARAVAMLAGIAEGSWRIAWQSAGMRGGTWLGPDVSEAVAGAARLGASAVVCCPDGFVADHLEVLYDLDVVIGGAARAHGIAYARTGSPNADPAFVAMAARLVAERAADLGWVQR